MGKKILVVLGHPSNESFCSALADTYVAAAKADGHDVQLLRLANLNFDPILHYSKAHLQPLEADLLAAQSAIKWAEHLTFVYPIWWGGAPALLKGFIDRVFLSGFAFKFHRGSPYPEQLLKGRTAHLLVTVDTPPWYFRWIYRMPGIHEMRKTTLEFCGIKPVKVLTFGPVMDSQDKQRDGWLAKARLLAGKIR
ncbi:MAG: NAD(P)H-dependent oxidoreductase [Pseudomonadota bacterium]